MRKILLATALTFVGAAPAFAVDATVTINSSLAKACDVSDATTLLTLDGITPANGSFTTTCNFSSATIDVTFDSQYGGVFNSVENVTAPYTLTYNLTPYTSADLLDGETATHAAGSSPTIRNYSVALNAALTVAGDYTDTLTITVVP